MRGLGIAVAFAVLAAPSSAQAYCRATNCSAQGAVCDPPLESDCGEPLRWERSCVGIAVQKEASNQVSYAQAKGTVRAAFSVWEEVDCGEGSPGFHVEILNKVDCADVEYNSDGGNVNVIVFRDEEWPHAEGAHNVALTTVTFDKDTAEIYDADIEVNTFGYPMTLSDDAASSEYDLLSILAHEAGHFLGMAHAIDNPDATMNSTYQPKTLDFRTLEPDDGAGMCAIYPPKESDEECNPIPRHGFSTACLVDQTEGKCALAAGPAPAPASGSPGPLAAAGAAIVLLARRRVTGRSGSRTTR